MTSLARRIDDVDWTALARDLDTQGYALTDTVLTPDECEHVAAGYDDEAQFRSVIDMQRHNFGSGEYKYFSYPLPAPVAELRAALYEPLQRVADHGRPEPQPGPSGNTNSPFSILGTVT